METMLRVALATAAVALILPAAAQSQQPSESPQPRYLAAIRAELGAIGIPAACEAETATRARCAWSHRGRASQRELNLHLIYSDDTDTIYFYVARYLLAPPDASSTPQLLRRLMELNWLLLAGKLEWDSNSGEVRLAMLMNTDSNFDRRAFRSVVRNLTAVADRYSGELSRIIDSEE